MGDQKQVYFIYGALVRRANLKQIEYDDGRVLYEQGMTTKRLVWFFLFKTTFFLSQTNLRDENMPPTTERTTPMIN